MEVQGKKPVETIWCSFRKKGVANPCLLCALTDRRIGAILGRLIVDKSYGKGLGGIHPLPSGDTRCKRYVHLERGREKSSRRCTGRFKDE